MKVAVTGGSGVVGGAVVRHLVAEGEEVWALARSPGASAKLDGMGAHVVHGDLFDEAALDRLCKGSRRVFHVAGVNEMCSLHPEMMWFVNVEGARLVLEASERAGVERLVHTSSAATIGEGRGVVGNENSRHRGHFLSEYERSKTVGERLIFNHAADVEVVAVNPSSVQGPGRSTGTGALLLAAARGNVLFLMDADFSLVDMDDCARGHLLAAEKGRPGERYLLSGGTLTVRQAVRELSTLVGRRRGPWFIKPEVVTGVAPAIGALSRALGRRPLLCAESARVLVHGHSYDGTKATRELGLEYTPVRETLRRAVVWFRREGLLD